MSDENEEPELITIKRLMDVSPVPIQAYTCYDCPLALAGCDFAWDLYNTDGDCLADK